jgi:hypothetical protein
MQGDYSNRYVQSISKAERKDFEYFYHKEMVKVEEIDV